MGCTNRGVWTTNANDIYNANTGKVGIGTGATAPASKLFVAGGSYNINSGANNANYALGAQSIAANDSIYSYGLICAGNNNGDCTGTGAGKWGVVISGSGIIFPDGTKQTTATAVDSTKVLKTGDSMTGPLTIGYSGSNGGSLNLTYGYQTTSGNINSSINVTGGPGVYTGGANGPITSAITATGGVISGGAGTSYALRAIAGSGGTGSNYSAYFNGTVKIVDGTQGTGKVLTSDANGVASWAALLTQAQVAGVWTTNANDIYNANTGNVGIGTTPPVASWMLMEQLILDRYN